MRTPDDVAFGRREATIWSGFDTCVTDRQSLWRTTSRILMLRNVDRRVHGESNTLRKLPSLAVTSSLERIVLRSEASHAARNGEYAL